MTAPAAKLNFPREMKEILSPLKQAMLEYQQALPVYLEAMRVRYPPRPPIDLDCNERRVRENLLVLANKMAAERDDDAIWRRNVNLELAVTAEVIAKKEEIPNVYRALLREMEVANERLRNTQRLIVANRKQMDDLRSEMESMNKWLHSGEPATKEMLRSVGLLKKTCSQPSQAAVVVPPPVKVTPAVRRNSSAASSRSSASSRFSEATAAMLRPNVTVTKSTTRQQHEGGRQGPTVRFKTRNAPKLVRAPGRAEYCPVGGTQVSFRKKSGGGAGGVVHERPNSAGNARTASPSGGAMQQQQQVVKPEERGARSRVASPVNARTVPRRNASEGNAAAVRKPNACGVARTQRPSDVTEVGSKRKCANVAEERPVAARRPRSATEPPKKRPPWRPMA